MSALLGALLVAALCTGACFGVHALAPCVPPQQLYAFDEKQDSVLGCVNVATGEFVELVDTTYDFVRLCLRVRSCPFAWPNPIEPWLARVRACACAQEGFWGVWGNDAVLSIAALKETTFAPVVVNTASGNLTELAGHPILPSYAWTLVVSTNSILALGCSANTLVVYAYSKDTVPLDAPVLLVEIPLTDGQSCAVAPLFSALNVAAGELYIALTSFSDSYQHEQALITTVDLVGQTCGQWIPIVGALASGLYVDLFFDPYRLQLLSFDSFDRIWSISPTTGATSHVSSISLSGSLVFGSCYFSPAGQRLFLALNTPLPSSSSTSSTGTSLILPKADAAHQPHEVLQHSRKATGRVQPRTQTVSLLVFDIDSGARLQQAALNLSQYSFVYAANEFDPVSMSLLL